MCFAERTSIFQPVILLQPSSRVVCSACPCSAWGATGAPLVTVDVWGCPPFQQRIVAWCPPVEPLCPLCFLIVYHLFAVALSAHCRSPGPSSSMCSGCSSASGHRYSYGFGFGHGSSSRFLRSGQPPFLFSFAPSPAFLSVLVRCLYSSEISTE
jgi:hypothetical protein